MILTEVFPNLGIKHEVTGLESQALVDLYPQVLGFRLNYVLSPYATGSTSDVASNELDRIILKFIRSQSDLIITTGLTARNENLNSSKYAPLLILTKSNEQFEIPAVQKDSLNRVYLTQKLGKIYPNSNALAIGGFQEGASQFTASFCRLNNLYSAVLETGLSTTREFSKGGLITEVDLTVTRVDSYQDALKFATGFLSSIEVDAYNLVQVLQHEDSWFFRLSIH